MTLLSEAWLAPPPLGPTVIAGAGPEALMEILRPEASLALWARPLPPPLRGQAAALAARPFEAVAEGPPEAALASLSCALPLALRHDMLALSLLFCGIAGREGLRIRLEALAGDGCRFFHADAVGLRLLCTYHGAGTQWLPLPGGARAARALDPATCPAPEQAAPGTVLLMKGEGHPGHAGRGLIHRSPPAPPGAGARLLLCLDEPGRIPLP
ncbi:DUF1826 domain-containing protein [Roseomonas sp. GC11]|uniref:DUF1826 domain-containing protein n=1 Tax=Roseomonas sp. GC11 TaxID=2950546 RepID=UPI00210CC5AB|nr:DUF1826 domain-containing protein [Roseomonas sp. GC11]MCQ4160707.1 DUF1826 domain-containing protein [Roseomonas sp. GC11]